MADTAAAKAQGTGLKGTQMALNALDRMAATAERVSRRCDEFIARQPERERIYSALMHTEKQEHPDPVAVRQEVQAELHAILSKSLKRVRQENSL